MVLSGNDQAELQRDYARIRELEEEVVILNRAAEKWKAVVPQKNASA